MTLQAGIGLVLLIVSCVVVGLVALEVKRKNMNRWLLSYLKLDSPKLPRHQTKHILFCFVDHYEPQWMKSPKAKADETVRIWSDRYPKMARQFVDSDGYHPKHSFFFPQEEYDVDHLTMLSDLCAQGFGEIEVHLHHENDTSEGLRTKLLEFVELLSSRHRALPVDPATGKPAYAFIHGNWALDNSSPDGAHCGVNNEITILRETGCYADFTFPSAPSATQPQTINRIYYAVDDPSAPNSHNTGLRMKVGGKTKGDLLLIQGPLAINWRWRKFGLVPRIENSDIRDTSPPLPARIDTWVKQGIHVEGRPDWIFVKIHTHGAQPSSIETLLGEPMLAMHRYLGQKYNDGKSYKLHYVTAREMYNLAKAAEAGEKGEPGKFRDYVLKKPSFVRSTQR